MGLTATRVLEELGRIAFSDIRGLFDEHGSLKPIQELAVEHAAAIASYAVARSKDAATAIYRIRLWDKVRALELLGKHFGLFTERVKVGVDDELLARLDEGRLRNAQRNMQP